MESASLHHLSYSYDNDAWGSPHPSSNDSTLPLPQFEPLNKAADLGLGTPQALRKRNGWTEQDNARPQPIWGAFGSKPNIIFHFPGAQRQVLRTRFTFAPHQCVMRQEYRRDSCGLRLLDTDDWGWPHWPVAGSAPDSMYPNIKADFIQDGVELKRMYSNTICGPSRRSLLSGRDVAKIGRCAL